MQLLKGITFIIQKQDRTVFVCEYAVRKNGRWVLQIED